jgi:hypothetical protein
LATIGWRHIKGNHKPINQLFMTIYQQIKEKSKIEGKLEVVLASFDDG